MSDNQKADALTPAQLAQLANAKPQGKRPRYFSDPMTEQVYSICIAMMAELAAARERIDTLERLLASKGVLADDEVDTYVPDNAAGQARQQAQMAYCARVLRPLQQQVEAMERQHELSTDEMAERLGTVEPDSSGHD